VSPFIEYKKKGGILMSGPYGDHDYGYGRDADWRHNTHYWNDGDGITHRESYDYNGQGDIRDLHYGESDRYGSEIVYNYHTGEWEDHSR